MPRDREQGWWRTASTRGRLLVPRLGAPLLLAVLLIAACGGRVPPDATQTCVDPPNAAKSIPPEVPTAPDGSQVTYLIVNDYKAAVVELEIAAASPGGFGKVMTTDGDDAFCLVPQDLSRVGEVVDVIFRAQGLVEAVTETDKVYSEAQALVTRKMPLGSCVGVGVFAEIRLGAFDGNSGVSRARAQVSFEKAEAGGLGVPLSSIQTASGTN